MNLHGEAGFEVDVTRVRGALQLVARTYPNPDALTLGRLNKILYLADWYAVKESGESVTGLRWFFDERGPTAEEIATIVSDENRFRIRPITNVYRVEVRAIDALDATDVPSIPSTLWDAVGRAVQLAALAPWPVFLATILDTAPLADATRGEYIDLRPYARAA
jgi:hypothetical protein